MPQLLDTTTLSATGSATLYKSSRARFANFFINGTYTGLTFVFEVSRDGVSWAPTAARLGTTGALVNGTLSPADAATLSYSVLCADLQYVRLRVTAISTNSVIVNGSADDLTQTAPDPTFAVAAADGAIGITSGTVFVTKGSAAALTLAAPATGVDDGKSLLIVSTTAFAHTVTQTTPGFNNGGAASDVATFGAAVGNWMHLSAYNGVWYSTGLLNVTLA